VAVVEAVPVAAVLVVVVAEDAGARHTSGRRSGRRSDGGRATPAGLLAHDPGF
jgi:hypothetical protein